MSKRERIIGGVLMAHAKERKPSVAHAREVWKQLDDWSSK